MTWSSETHLTVDRQRDLHCLHHPLNVHPISGHCLSSPYSRLIFFYCSRVHICFQHSCEGLSTCPKNNTAPYSSSMVVKTNGWSAINSGSRRVQPQPMQLCLPRWLQELTYKFFLGTNLGGRSTTMTVSSASLSMNGSSNPQSVQFFRSFKAKWELALWKLRRAKAEPLTRVVIL